jgi:hypothetical protein
LIVAKVRGRPLASVAITCDRRVIEKVSILVSVAGEVTEDRLPIELLEAVSTLFNRKRTKLGKHCRNLYGAFLEIENKFAPSCRNIVERKI